MSRSLLMFVSVGVHLGLAVGLGKIHVEKAAAATAIEIAEVKKKAEPPPPPPVIEPPKPAENKPVRRAAQQPLPEAAPPPEQAQAQAFDAVPDFGLALSGGSGEGGVAVPQGNSLRAAPAPEKVVKRVLAAAPAPALAGDGCADPPAKPKPISVPQPVYTESARAAGIEGKVRVQLTVDATGKVVSVSILSGLGYGLDEAALAAARSAQFEPAVRCGKPTSATFTISMRFSAG